GIQLVAAARWGNDLSRLLLFRGLEHGIKIPGRFGFAMTRINKAGAVK
ncbi:MAG: hypothetical protein IPI39_12335, partial [Candidatus Obscuribacter sp.]|nr:hypothetical protein [Candidatus Obscuribacter sp.]